MITLERIIPPAYVVRVCPDAQPGEAQPDFVAVATLEIDQHDSTRATMLGFHGTLTHADIHEADAVFQLYDDTPQRIKETYGEYEGFDEYWAGSVTDEGSGEMRAKEMHGEQRDTIVSRLNIYRRMAEHGIVLDDPEQFTDRAA